MASSHHVHRMSGCFLTFWDRPTHAKLTPLDIALPHRYVGHPPLATSLNVGSPQECFATVPAAELP